MIANRSTVGVNQFVRAVTQSVGGQKVTTSFPSLKRDWEEREEYFPSLLPAFASDMPLKKFSFSKQASAANQQKPVFNLNSHLFNKRSQAVSGIGGLLICFFL